MAIGHCGGGGNFCGFVCLKKFRFSAIANHFELTCQLQNAADGLVLQNLSLFMKEGNE